MKNPFRHRTSDQKSQSQSGDDLDAIASLISGRMASAAVNWTFSSGSIGGVGGVISDPALPTITHRGEVTGSITGYRAWRIQEVDGKPRLHSTNMEQRWEPGEEIHAEDKDLGSITAHGPGVYAAKDINPLIEGPQGLVIGRVELWGDVHVHTNGYRAEYAIPLDLQYGVCQHCAQLIPIQECDFDLQPEYHSTGRGLIISWIGATPPQTGMVWKAQHYRCPTKSGLDLIKEYPSLVSSDRPATLLQ